MGIEMDYWACLIQRKVPRHGSPLHSGPSQAWARLVKPQKDLTKCVPIMTQRLCQWSRGHRAHNLMNSMVLTSGEVTGLNQDRVSIQDAVAGKHRSKCCDD